MPGDDVLLRSWRLRPPPSSSSSGSPSPCDLVGYGSNTSLALADNALYGCFHTSSKEQPDVQNVGQPSHPLRFHPSCPQATTRLSPS
ncbi:hypothetical protein SESBI_11248 [Sesbania bispinosa]|nr:hypothetical protein SESBI_11248 [Sesbania bispinosa]